MQLKIWLKDIRSRESIDGWEFHQLAVGSVRFSSLETAQVGKCTLRDNAVNVNVSNTQRITGNNPYKSAYSKINLNQYVFLLDSDRNLSKC